MLFIAGSTGDPNAPQLIIDMRSVTLEYAKDNKKYGINNNSQSDNQQDNRDSNRPIRSDWLCEVEFY